MPNYKYKAMNEQGEKIEGVYYADSEDAVIEMIKTNNYYPLKIESLEKPLSFDFEDLKKVKLNDIAVFCRQFYTMLDAGSSIDNALHILSTQVPNKKLRKSLKDVEDSVRKGSTLAESMDKHKDVFPNLLIKMIDTGETSGTLDIIMLRMSKHYEKQNKISNKIKNAMIYPIVLGVVAVAVIIFILTFIMPMFVDMFKEQNITLPASTRFLVLLSNGIKHHGLMVLFIIICIVFGFKYYFKTENGQMFKSKFKLSFPIIKTLNEKIIVSTFTRTLSTVLASGIPLVQAVKIVNEVIENKIINEKLDIVDEKIIKGEGLSEPIKESEVFPLMLYSMIKIGEESGKLDDILNKTADFYDEELENQIQNTTALLEPIMIVVMGVIVGFLIISIITPVFSIYSSI